jgi:carbon storage regulator
MLVLTRKIGEQIFIGDNIKVSIVSIGPGRVKVGIEAPPWVEVNRQEVFEKKLAEKTPSPAAVLVDPDSVLQPTPPPMAGLPLDPDMVPLGPVSETLTGAVHNRIADKLTAELETVAVPPAPKQPDVRKARLPRKPR